MRTKLNCKVVWWVADGDNIPKRMIRGKREPLAAWRMFFQLREINKRTGHIVAGPELWIGRKLVMASGNTEKGLVLPWRV